MSVLTDLCARVAEIIPRYNMLSRGERVGVAVSGGADSVALLRVFCALAEAFQFTPVLLHVNHGLRGAESEGDEQFVRELADRLALEAIIDRHQAGRGNLEQAAREARREFLLRLIADRRVSRVALGHTRSDQAETVLFRLLRGAGTCGLAAMRHSSPEGFIRPLLDFSREEIREWLGAQGQAWREDSSNQDQAFARNRLRNHTLPALVRDYNANLEAVLAGTAEVAAGEEDYWREVTDPLIESTARATRLGWIVDCAALNALHLAVRRRLVRAILKALRGDLRRIDLAHVEAVLALTNSLQGHDRVLIPGADVIRSYRQMLFSVPGARDDERDYALDITPEVRCELPYGAGSICLDWVNFEQQICDNFKKDQQAASEVTYLSTRPLASGENTHLRVRNWRPGDQLCRAGHKGAEKIKSFFQEHRVPLWLRRHWPVLVAGPEIIWTRDFGCARGFQVSKESERALRVTYWAGE